MKNKKFGFTLAEVLITLAIIGVVAVLTLPTLMSNYRKKEVETKLSKVNAVMNQAIKLSEVDNGDKMYWDWSIQYTDSGQKKLDWYNKYLKKYLNVSKVEITNYGTYSAIIFYFQDGSALLTPDTQDYDYYVNAKSIENIIKGVNTFRLRFAPAMNTPQNKYHYKQGFGPYTWGWDGNPEHLYSGEGSYAHCDSTDQGHCVKIIELNGWKIPNDYPFHI